MSNVLLAECSYDNGDITILTFVGTIQGHKVSTVILDESNYCLTKGTTYLIRFKKYCVIGESVVLHPIKVRNIGDIDWEI